MKMNENIKFGYIENGTGMHQSNTVWSTNGVCPVLTTLQGGTQQVKVLVVEDDNKNETNKIVKLGNCSNGRNEGGMVYSPIGLINTITAGTHGYGMGYYVINEDE